MNSLERGSSRCKADVFRQLLMSTERNVIRVLTNLVITVIDSLVSYLPSYLKMHFGLTLNITLKQLI